MLSVVVDSTEAVIDFGGGEDEAYSLQWAITFLKRSSCCAMRAVAYSIIYLDCIDVIAATHRREARTVHKVTHSPLLTYATDRLRKARLLPHFGRVTLVLTEDLLRVEKEYCPTPCGKASQHYR